MRVYHLLHGALLLNLALTELLQQHQLGLLESQFLFQLLDNALPFLRRTLLRTAEKMISVGTDPKNVL